MSVFFSLLKDDQLFISLNYTESFDLNSLFSPAATDFCVAKVEMHCFK